MEIASKKSIGRRNSMSVIPTQICLDLLVGQLEGRMPVSCENAGGGMEG